MKTCIAVLFTLALFAACRSPRPSGTAEPAALGQPEIRYYLIADA